MVLNKIQSKNVRFNTIGSNETMSISFLFLKKLYCSQGIGICLIRTNDYIDNFKTINKCED